MKTKIIALALILLVVACTTKVYHVEEQEEQEEPSVLPEVNVEQDAAELDTEFQTLEEDLANW